MVYRVNASLETTPTKKTTGIKITKKISTQVKTDAALGGSLFKKNLKTGRKTPVETAPNMIMAKKGAISLPARKITLQNSTIKKIKTAL